MSEREYVQQIKIADIERAAPDASMARPMHQPHEITALTPPWLPAVRDHATGPMLDDLNTSYPPQDFQMHLRLPTWRWSYLSFTVLMCFFALVITVGFLGNQYAQTLAIRNAYTASAPGPDETWISITPTQVAVLTVPTPRDDNKVYQVVGGWTVVTPKTANTYRNLTFTGYEQGNLLNIQYLDGKPVPMWGTYTNGAWTLHFAPSGTLVLHLAGGADFINAITAWKAGNQ